MARRKGGLYLPLDVQFFEDPKVLRAGEKAGWLYLNMALACKRLGTDGVLEHIQIERLHVPNWRGRLSILIREQLVLDYENGTYALASWLIHNDPIAVVTERRQQDAARKRGVHAQPPHGLRTDSAPSRSVERSREKRREVHGPCPGCADCGTSLRVVSQ